MNGFAFFAILCFGVLAALFIGLSTWRDRSRAARLAARAAVPPSEWDAFGCQRDLAEAVRAAMSAETGAPSGAFQPDDRFDDLRLGWTFFEPDQFDSFCGELQDRLALEDPTLFPPCRGTLGEFVLILQTRLKYGLARGFPVRLSSKEPASRTSGR